MDVDTFSRPLVSLIEFAQKWDFGERERREGKIRNCINEVRA